MRGNSHVRFGGRPGETDPEQSGHRAPGRPNCTVPAAWCQVHHANTDWAAGGHTDIDNLTLACGPDNRLANDDGRTTRKPPGGTTDWIPAACGSRPTPNQRIPPPRKVPRRRRRDGLEPLLRGQGHSDGAAH
ncbi:MAG TPA: HNH endonuclease signature motif containing protein, partial [Mycobacterium sp.]|nr:HNH endonuclease signature motif containing protein [Mycobacterium sp.]